MLALLFTGCATYEAKYSKPEEAVDVISSGEVAHTFYLIGDAGLSPLGQMNGALKIFRDKLNKAPENSTAIFLGDNIYPAGLPDPKDSTMAFRVALNHLDAQLRTVEKYPGRVLFIPGNHDYYTEGLVGLKRQEEYLERNSDQKDVFLPESGCPMEVVEVNEDILLIVVDSEWYLTNWDKRPSINEDCKIKSREKFLEELENEIKKNAGKTILLAMHHPLFSYGPHGGQYTLNQQFYPAPKFGPLPILGTLVNLFRKTAGASSEDMQNKRYRELVKRIITIAQFNEKVIVASGHEHALQFIIEQNIPQIVSGAGAKTGATNLLNGSKFSTGGMGYAILEVYKDGSSRVRFYGLDGPDKEKFLYTSGIYTRDTTVNEQKYPDAFPTEISTSIYSEEEVKRSIIFRKIWGERYRKYYGIKVNVPIIELDTMLGGLSPIRKGGGHQSKSLRLRHKGGKEYVMRALRKDAERYLQAIAFKDQYIIGEFEDTFTEGLLEDFYTGAHPYAPLTIGILSEAAGVYHTNPKLYYVPKQPQLGDFNSEFGDELYLIEEHVSDGHGDLESFGYADKVESTYDMLDKLRQDEKYTVDTDRYIRARLFDMVIGDWDRHVDQWRWAAFEDKDNDRVFYRPIPRDRDQAFSIMGDGILMNITTRLIPSLKLMEGFQDQIRNVKTFNSNPFSLDIALLTGTVKSDWDKQVAYLQEHITEAVINRSFDQIPAEIRDETTSKIKEILSVRLKQLGKTAEQYYAALNQYAVVRGTDKDDWLEITALDEGKTQVKAYRIIAGKKERLFFNKVFDKRVTREIWIYGLDDKDYFETLGDYQNSILVKLVGGNGQDVFDIKNSNKISLYDYKTKDNIFKRTEGAKVRLLDSYQVNTYQPLKLISNRNQLVPTIGFNPDDGLRLGASNTYTHYGFRQNPFSEQHRLDASFYFATSGFDLAYNGEFANIFQEWNFAVNAKFTSPNFSVNFFGLGNDTPNFDDDLGMDYNRVRLQTLGIAPSLVWRGPLGASFRIGMSYEDINVEETEGRFVNTFYAQNNEDSSTAFFGIESEYHYENVDNPSFPTLGMSSSLKMGYKTNVSGNGGEYGYVIPALSLDQKLLPSGVLVLATQWKAQFNIGNGYQFYQGASIGASDGPRGFRNQRFTGKTSYYQNTDIRLRLRKMKTGLLPISLGIFGGFDYGRVWHPEDQFDRWHTSYGGGLFLNGADIFSARFSLFHSEEGPRFLVGLGFGF